MQRRTFVFKLQECILLADTVMDGSRAPEYNKKRSHLDNWREMGRFVYFHHGRRKNHPKISRIVLDISLRKSQFDGFYFCLRNS